MWIDFERRHGVIAPLFYGRHAWLIGSNSEGSVSAEVVYLPHSRARRLAAAGVYED